MNGPILPGETLATVRAIPTASHPMFTVKNAYTGTIYTQVPTLTAARNYCEQHLLRSAASREGYLSNLAAQIITVYDASNTCYRGTNF